MNDPVRLKIELPKIPDIELVALEGLDRLGRHLGISGEKLGEARIIVTEAIVNGLEHGSTKNPSVTVEFTMSQAELTVHVRDYGSGFNPSSVPEPELKSKLASGDKRGWGLKLMKSMSDDFRIESDASGTKITIKKLLK